MTVKPEKVPGIVNVKADSAPEVRLIPVELIDLSSKHRKADPDFTEALARNIAERGQISPIDVVELDGRFLLVHGASRVAAMKWWGIPTIAAVVSSGADFGSETSIRLRAIAAQVVRRDLTVMDRAMAVAEWRELFELVVGVVKRGVKAISVRSDTNSDEALMALSEEFSGTFTQAAQRALSLSQKGVFRALKIASIEPTIRDAVALHPLANNQTELLALAEAAAEEQQQASALVLDGSYTGFIAALAFVQNKPAAPILMPWETFAQRFTRLKEEEQERFFNTHADAIERWWLRRSNR